MKRRPPRQRPGARLRTGDALLTRCSVVDTTLVADRLQRFASLHQDYAAAQHAVTTARAAVAEHHARLAEAVAAEDHALEELLRALAVDRCPRMRPLSPYCKKAPSLIKRMPAQRKAAILHTAVLAVRRDLARSAGCHAAADILVAAGERVAAARAELVRSEAVLQRELLRRDAIGVQWDRGLAALRRTCEFAEDEGATGLRAFLFPPRRRRRPAPRAPAVTPVEDAAPHPSTPESANPDAHTEDRRESTPQSVRPQLRLIHSRAA